jgi:hypothetical protein
VRIEKSENLLFFTVRTTFFETQNRHLQNTARARQNSITPYKTTNKFNRQRIKIKKKGEKREKILVSIDDQFFQFRSNSQILTFSPVLKSLF